MGSGCLLCFDEYFCADVGAKEGSSYEGGVAYNAFAELFVLGEGGMFWVGVSCLL